MALNADAEGVLVRLHSTQVIFNSLPNPSTVISDAQKALPQIFFLSSDWLFDMALKQVRVKVVVVRFRVTHLSAAEG